MTNLLSELLNSASEDDCILPFMPMGSLLMLPLMVCCVLLRLKAISSSSSSSVARVASPFKLSINSLISDASKNNSRVLETIYENEIYPKMSRLSQDRQTLAVMQYKPAFLFPQEKLPLERQIGARN